MNPQTNNPLTQLPVQRPGETAGMADPDEIRKSLVLTLRLGFVYELRTIGKPYSGYFNDFEKLAQEAERLSGMDGVEGVYVTLNPCNPEFLARANNRVKWAKPGSGAGNKDIVRRFEFLIDIDPVRPSGISATDAEKEKARIKAIRVRDYLTSLGWPKSLFADSGNGYHVRYHLDLPNDDASEKVLKNCLNVLDAKFSDGDSKVDTAVSNAARICKLYGTLSAKGDHTTDRPHRIGYVIEDGDPTNVTLEQLPTLAGEYSEPKKAPPESTPAGSTGRGMRFGGIRYRYTAGEIEALLDAGGVEHSEKLEYEKGFKWQITCIFDPSHEKPDAVIYLIPSEDGDGMYAAHKCSHDSCKGRDWKAFIQELRAQKPEMRQEHFGEPTGAGSMKTLENSLRAINDSYIYVDENDLVVRLADAHMYKAENFRSGGHMANRFFVREITDESGTTRRKKIPLGKAWLEWADRRQVANMVYEPGKDQVLSDAVNRWRGMGVDPIAGDISVWKELLEHLIPDPIARKWFEQWCAYPLQNLGAKLETAVVLWSVQQGTGKTTIYQTLRRIYAKNAEKISESDLQAQFNDWARDRQLIYADEISGGDKRKTSDFLKELITGSEIRVNQKFLPPITIRNCIQFLFSSNHPNAFYLEPDDRRFLIIEVAPGLSKAFFDRYYAWLDNGGAANVYAHLLTLPMVGFDPHGAPPMTADKQAMIDLGRSDVERWLDENRDFVGTASEWLSKFRDGLSIRRSTNLTESGMLAALKRSGGVNKRITVDGKKLRVWSLDLSEKHDPLVWQERYEASHPSDRRRTTAKPGQNGYVPQDCNIPF
jgi:hypothetical protein